MASYATDLIALDDPGKHLTVYTITEGTKSGYPKEKHFCSRCGCMLWSVPLKYDGKVRMVRTSLVEDGCVVTSSPGELIKSI